MSKSSANTDFFGTYLQSVQGRTAIEGVVEQVRNESRSIEDLVNDLRFSPEEIVSAIANAAKLGIVRLEKVDGRTMVAVAATESK